MGDADPDARTKSGVDSDSMTESESHMSEGDAFLAALGASTRGGIDLSFNTSYPIYEDDADTLSVDMADASAFLRSDSTFDDGVNFGTDDDDIDDLRMYSGDNNAAVSPTLNAPIDRSSHMPTSPKPIRIVSKTSNDSRQRTSSRSSKSALSLASIEPSVFPSSFDWQHGEEPTLTSEQEPDTTIGYYTSWARTRLLSCLS